MQEGMDKKKKGVSYFPLNELRETKRALVRIVRRIAHGELHAERASEAVNARALDIVSDRERRPQRAVEDLIADDGLGLEDLDRRVLMDATGRDADVDLVRGIHFGFGFWFT